MLSDFLIILLIFGIVGFIELPTIIKERQWKEFTVFSVFFLLGLTITIMYQIFEFDFSGISHWLVSVFSYD
ncbi:MAG: hypothetical protein A2Y24_06955 [Clostridiales bacterium GWE2_32_10]|nr:MAG: hypothetical protein A2Y24_06955 [Clostridiales bacterium GWE2_32_10]